MWEKANAAGIDLISIIVPALDEEQEICQTLEAARRGSSVELIVVDGGSADSTASLARKSGAVVINSSGGRAAQMNAGARAATGDMLLFLHADTRLPERYDGHVRRILRQKLVIAGAFKLCIDSPGPSFRLVETLANFRSQCLGMPYGDQGLFIRKDAFLAAGLFAHMHLMEDYEIVRRLRRSGRIVVAPAAATASARRWLKVGVLRTTLLNQVIILAYHLGVSPDRLARWYRSSKRQIPR